MAAPEDLTHHPHALVNLMRLCDWTQPRSWFVLLGRGLEFGTFGAILAYLLSVYVLGLPTGRFDAATLSVVFPLVAALALFIAVMVMAVMSAASRRSIRTDPLAPRPATGRTDLLGDLAIRMIWFGSMALPLLAAHRGFLDTANSLSGTVFAAIFIIAVGASRSVLPYLLKRWCPPGPGAAV